MSSPRPECYCVLLPMQGTQLLARCNVCVNEILEAKNDLVRENQELLEALQCPTTRAEKKPGSAT